MRWRHPNHGVISPDAFIPLAQNSGLIGPMSRRAVESALETLALLRTAGPGRAMQVLHELRELGVRLAIDDFGTGYSSLSYLRRLQPDELKVDKSFVMQMDSDENSAVIVRSTVELGHGLGLSVVAEGVEDQDTYDALTGLGCDRLQGFHIARPMTEAALKTWLVAQIVRRAAATAATDTGLVPSQTGHAPGAQRSPSAAGTGTA